MRNHAIRRQGWSGRRRQIAVQIVQAVATFIAAAALAAGVWGITVLVLLAR